MNLLGTESLSSVSLSSVSLGSKPVSGKGDVVAVVAPLGGVAQVVSHGVNVLGVHGEEGKDKDEEVRGEVKGEVEQLREKRSSWMVCG